jgi:hypothetical protein
MHSLSTIRRLNAQRPQNLATKPAPATKQQQPAEPKK